MVRNLLCVSIRGYHGKPVAALQVRGRLMRIQGRSMTRALPFPRHGKRVTLCPLLTLAMRLSLLTLAIALLGFALCLQLINKTGQDAAFNKVDEFLAELLLTEAYILLERARVR